MYYFSFKTKRVCVAWLQDVHIDLENPHKMHNFHFAVSGQAFAVLTTHFPEYIPRVIWGTFSLKWQDIKEDLDPDYLRGYDNCKCIDDISSFWFQVVVKGTVFARMSPDQKLQLIEELQNIGYIHKLYRAH